jgi:hypothetical protein
MNDTGERMFPFEFSNTIGSVAKALATAQGEIKDAAKDAENPGFKRGNQVSKYATLSSVRAAITPAFSKNGLCVTQYFEPHGDSGVCIITLLAHESGEWIKSKLFLPVSKKDAQGFGSAISYARRYALAAIANVASDDDDDGNEAVKPAKGENKPETKAPPASGIDVDSLVEALAKAKDDNEMAKAILAVGRVKDKLSTEQLKRCTDMRDNRVRELASQAA